MAEFRGLQIGGGNWEKEHQLGADVQWDYYAPGELQKPDKPREYNVVILDAVLTEREIQILRKLAAAYTVFYLTEALCDDPVTAAFLRNVAAKHLKETEVGEFIQMMQLRYWSGQYGEAIQIDRIELSPGYRGTIRFDGSGGLELRGDFGEKKMALLSWRYAIPLRRMRGIDLWLEYIKRDRGIRIWLYVRLCPVGSPDEIAEVLTFDEEQMRNQITIPPRTRDFSILISLMAEGTGAIEVRQLHFRESRLGAGSFLVGGTCTADARRQEVLSYFCPGDRKKPLCVYFGGYATREGFEGYNMMRRLGTPFLLLNDARLKGGSFYIGSEEYEAMVEQTIRDALTELGFGTDALILSGLSMGTYGALYYGAKLCPNAIIIGKPLANLGSIAKNESTIRPGGFETSLDILKRFERDNSERAARELDQRIWKRFDQAEFTKTEFAVAYMQQDDYDTAAYADLLHHLWGKKVRIYGKGLPGRHNDNTKGIVNWFLGQYRRILRTNFNRT